MFDRVGEHAYRWVASLALSMPPDRAPSGRSAQDVEWPIRGHRVMLVSMGTFHELRPPRLAGEVTWLAAIGLGIGDDDTITDVAESEHHSEQAAREWVEQTLPNSQFPEWVTRRPHGTAGAFLFGQIIRGYYTTGQDEAEPNWEPDPDAPSWDADLIDGVLRWRKR